MDELARFTAHLIQDKHVTLATAKRYVAIIAKYQDNLTSTYLIPHIQELLQTHKPDSLNAGLVNAVRAWGHFTNNPDLLLIKKLPVVKNAVTRSILSVDEIHQLLSLPPKNIDKKRYEQETFIFEVLSRCAFRPITLLRARVHMVNLGLNTFDFPGEITKTRQPQAIPIPRELLQKIKDHIKDKQPSDYLFTYNGKMINRNKLTDHFTQRIRRLGIKRNVSLYSLRHSAACRMLHNSNILVLKKYLSHNLIETSEKYIHLDTQDIADAMDRDELVKGNMPIPEIFKQIVAFVKNLISGDKMSW